MYSASASVKTSRGDANLLGFVKAIESNAFPTVGDLLYAGQRQRSRILQRTARGVDVDEVAFHPYSTKGPYYYYPGKNSKNRKAAASRFAKKVGVKKAHGRLGVKFPSYAAFKASLGRMNVDLRGPSAPHMLQAIIIRVKGFVLALSGYDFGMGVDLTPNDAGSKEPANEIVMGTYGAEADRASGHNEGAGHLPRRHFFGASESDKVAVLNDILTRIVFRVRKALGMVGGAR